MRFPPKFACARPLVHCASLLFTHAHSVISMHAFLSHIHILFSAIRAPHLPCTPSPHRFVPSFRQCTPSFRHVRPHPTACDFLPSILEFSLPLFVPPNLLIAPLVVVQKMWYIRDRGPSCLHFLSICGFLSKDSIVGSLHEIFGMAMAFDSC
jgi:hypothetical protein